MNKVIFHNKSLIDYKVCWDFQEKLFKFITDRKMLNRNLELYQQVSTQSHLIFCEHPHVFTLGKSGDEENLLANEEQLKEINATYYKINWLIILSLITTAIASILLLAGTIEEKKDDIRWYKVLGLLSLCLVTVLADGVLWNANYLKMSSINSEENFDISFRS